MTEILFNSCRINCIDNSFCPSIPHLPKYICTQFILYIICQKRRPSIDNSDQSPLSLSNWNWTTPQTDSRALILKWRQLMASTTNIAESALTLTQQQTFFFPFLNTIYHSSSNFSLLCRIFIFTFRQCINGAKPADIMSADLNNIILRSDRNMAYNVNVRFLQLLSPKKMKYNDLLLLYE